MLVTAEDVTLVPGLLNQAALPTGWLYRLLGAADNAVKAYCKQNLEYANYLEYFSGDGGECLFPQELPLWSATATIDPASAGQALPQATIYLSTVTGFPPGTGGDPNATPPSVAVQTSTNSWSVVTYTGLQASPPALTGCAGGKGTLFLPANLGQASSANVYHPVVYLDPAGYAGQSPAGFAEGTLLPAGGDWIADVDRSPRGAAKSHRGLLRRLGGLGGGPPGAGGWGPSWGADAVPSNYGKLSGRRLAGWPWGRGNVKVLYAAGYDPRPGPAGVPADLKAAAVMMVAQLARVMPNGSNMSSEGLGAYSYSMLYGGNNPELGEVRRTLARYRLSSFGR